MVTYYHSGISMISRGSGKSVASRAAYICGCTVFDSYCGVPYRNHRIDVVYCEVVLPMDAPQEYKDVQTLVTAIDQSEKRRDAQTAREVIFALPKELPSDRQIDLARQCVRTFWVDRGMCTLLAIHDKGDNKLHAHVLLTMRNVSSKGFGLKNREWNSKKLYHEWRQFLAETINFELRQKGLDARVSAESYIVQGIELTPTYYLGPTACALIKRGVFTERAEANLAIMAERRRKEMEIEEERQLDAYYYRRRTI